VKTLRPNSTARRGLTLMELIVVLVILIALAGIVVPLLPSMLGRAETATGATSQTEIAKLVQTFEQLNFKYPRDWDALMDGSGTFMTYVRGGPDIGVQTIVAGEDVALAAAGIDRLQLMLATPPNATFDNYGNADYALNGVAPTVGNKLVYLTVTGQKKLGLALNGTTSSGKYVVLGFGRRSSMVGNTTANAPVVFRDSGAFSPDTVYCRYGVVFKVADLNGPIERARFVGVCNFKPRATGDGIFTSDDDLDEFYDLNKGGS
jgi:type II secretory pathway pseudopilin PulG